MSIDFYVKARDAAQMIADAANEQLEKMVPPEVEYNDKDYDGLKWTTQQGTKGDYQQTTKEANNNSEVFQALQKILMDHEGFWQSSTHKYWLHSGDPNIMDRRKK